MSSDLLALCLGSGSQSHRSQAGYAVLFLAPGDLRSPEGQQVRPAYSPVLLTVFLKGFLCHGLHKFRIVPGDFFWDHHSDGVGIKELHDHLSEARGNIGVRSLRANLEGKTVREELKCWSKWTCFAAKARLKSGQLLFAFD